MSPPQIPLPQEGDNSLSRADNSAPQVFSFNLCPHFTRQDRDTKVLIPDALFMYWRHHQGQTAQLAKRQSCLGLPEGRATLAPSSLPAGCPQRGRSRTPEGGSSLPPAQPRLRGQSYSCLQGIVHCRASTERRGASGVPRGLAQVGQMGMQGVRRGK